ncbi:chemotaxis protein CheB [Pedobacter puniceum]|jgi:two-component system chemotaxis response regulator CheB|uniref:protein-glutamate methylesterase n=1 Tax=Pedobacter puniceum TaxID=2666136 RepID=A0A7K0FMI1_9SPHI|nr:chemotaxis protein CheB [Pedobacter puniceum]MRX47176.1 chemotaxis protein CheB [Pedobacter puniceum]
METIFIIGGSAGSLKVLLEVLPQLHHHLKFPIIIVLHRKGYADSQLSFLLSTKTNLKVVEPDDKDILEPGYIYIAPPDYHLLIESDKTISLDFSEKLNFSRPSIDVTFSSAAKVFKENTFAILLSGANADGVAGLNHVKANNGTTLVQNPVTAEVNYMPLQAITQSKIDFVLNPDEIAAFINKLDVP